MAQLKTLCTVVLETSDNIGQKKILFNFVLILLEQHCTSNYPMQWCPLESKEDCTRQNPV